MDDVDEVVACPDCATAVTMRRAAAYDALLREVEMVRGRCPGCGWERVRVTRTADAARGRVPDVPGTRS